MDSRMLKFHYNNWSVCVDVEDTDKVNFIDVLNDLVDESDRRGVSLPRYPCVSYTYNQQEVSLNNDLGFMNMFDAKTEKVLDLWIGEVSSPTHVWNSAMNLRKFKVNSEVIATVGLEPPTSRRSKLQIVRPHKNSQNPSNVIHSSTPLGYTSLCSDVNHPNPSFDIPHISPDIAHDITTPYYTATKATKPPSQDKKRATNLYRGKKIPATSEKRARKAGLTIEKFNVSFGRTNSSSRVARSVQDSELDHDESISDDDILNVTDCYEPNNGQEWSNYFDEHEDYFDKLFQNGELYVDDKFGKIQLKSWMLFADKKHFKMVFREYCIQEGFSVVVRRSEKERYTAECASLGCPFKIHTGLLADGFTWAIKSFHVVHKCQPLMNHNPMASFKWVAEKLLEDIRVNNEMCIKDCNDLLYSRYGISLKRSTAYNMRAYALTLIHGGHDTSYNKLPTYCEVIRETNPGSIAHCSWVEGQPTKEKPEKPLVFKYIFISFMASFRGFLAGCRGLIGVDGVHLKGTYRGVLLSAVAIDGNNEIFPIAHAIVGEESKETWSIFLWHLKDMLSKSDRNDWCIISDRQKGILPAIEVVWPTVAKRFCARHLLKSFKKSFPGPLMHALFWRVANSYSEFTFKKAIERLEKQAGKGAVAWFDDLGGHELWARYKIEPGLCQDENTTNFVESFNSLLGSDRSKPVLTLLEGIRRMSMVRHAKRQANAETWDEYGVCPKIDTILKMRAKNCRTCKVFNAGQGRLEIQDGQSYLPISLQERTCACGQWQISGIPCKHAMRAILHVEESPIAYCSQWYSVKRYKEAYGLNINPVGDSGSWHEYSLPEIEHPPMKRGIGRPPRNRRREEGEPRKGKRSTTTQCQKCKAFGHNSRSCKGGPTAKEVRESQGLQVQQKQRKRKGSQVQISHVVDTLSQDVNSDLSQAYVPRETR